MMFRKNIEPRCAYCTRGTAINDGEVVCVKHGVMPAEDCCGAFHYDPLKRVPPRPVAMMPSELTAEDFDI